MGGIVNSSRRGFNIIRFLLSFLFILTICHPSHAQQNAASTEGAEPGLIGTEIDNAIQESIFKAGAFRFRPNLQVLGGYDSNAFSSADNPLADEYFKVIPAVRTFLIMSDRAVINLDEDLNIVYYRNESDLSDVFSVTHPAIAFGGSRWLIKADDSFQTGVVRPSTEFDTPTDQRTNNFDASFAIAVGDRSDIGFYYNNFYLKILDPTITSSDGIPLTELLNRNTALYGGRFTRNITETSSAIGEFYYEQMDFATESVQPNATIYAGRGGFTFSAREHITGRALMGYKSMTPDDITQPDFRGLIASVNLSIRAGERSSIGVSFIRDAQPSTTANNWFFVQNTVGGSVEYYLTRNFSITGGVTYDKNTYPNQVLVQTTPGQPPVLADVKDDTVDALFGAHIHLTSYWWLFVEGDSSWRTSNLPDNEKNRFQVNGGIGTRF
jgi:Putative beta-barrel porin 2